MASKMQRTAGEVIMQTVGRSQMILWWHLQVSPFRTAMNALTSRHGWTTSFIWSILNHCSGSMSDFHAMILWFDVMIAFGKYFSLNCLSFTMHSFLKYRPWRRRWFLKQLRQTTASCYWQLQSRKMGHWKERCFHDLIWPWPWPSVYIGCLTSPGLEWPFQRHWHMDTHLCDLTISKWAS